MKKIINKIGFIILCILIFVVVVFISFQVTLYVIASRAKAPWNTDWNESIGIIYKDIDVNIENQTGYDLYLPANKDLSRNYSLIMYIHGGGFSSGDKAGGEMVCKYYASKGYVAASVNYTLADGEHDSNLNLMYEQLVSQVDSIKTKSSEYGYNITEMATSGDSAGGTLAMLYAYREPENSPIPVKFVFQMTGPATFNPEKWGSTDKNAQAAFIETMTGEEVTLDMIDSGEAMEIVDKISPASLVNVNTVPSILAYGTKDKVVPVNLKFSLIEALDKYGVRYDYIEFPNSGHAMALDADKSQLYADTVDEYLEKYFTN